MQKISLSAQVRPGLVLGPGMQLALDLLQIPALELRDRIQRELVENPALELDDEASAFEAEGSPGRDEGERPVNMDEPWPGGAEHAVEGTEHDGPGNRSLPDEDREFAADPDTWLFDRAVPSGSTEESERSGWTDGPAPPFAGTLAGHLLPQFRLGVRDPEMLALGEFLIGCLDDRGYLGCTLEEAAESAGTDPARLQQALALVQALDPPGIGARDLRECLLLQLEARGRAGSLAWRMVSERFDLLAGAKPAPARRAFAASPAEQERALLEIRRLWPHPGTLVAGGEVRYIYPDLIVETVGRAIEIYANERAVPRLRISGCCRALLGSGTGDAVSRRYALTRMRSARWLMAAVDRRRRTMLQVMRCIAEMQEGFFRDGPIRLRPLTLAEVAGRLHLHESTIARVIRSKYVQTPRGIYPLKYFFSNRVPTVTGDDTSGRAVRERIRELIEQEDRSSPLSDTAIAGILGRTGVKMARRTVSKYRSSLRIERAPLRRKAARSPAGSGDRGDT